MPDRNIKNCPALDILDRLYKYDPTTGVLLWRTGPRQGLPAGKLTTNQISIAGEIYVLSRVIFKIIHRREPAGLVDHKDRDWKNNRKDNLREASESQNQANKTLRSDNKTGYHGLHQYQWDRGLWQGSFSFNGRKYWTSKYDDRETALGALKRLKLEVQGEYHSDG